MRFNKKTKIILTASLILFFILVFVGIKMNSKPSIDNEIIEPTIGEVKSEINITTAGENKENKSEEVISSIPEIIEIRNGYGKVIMDGQEVDFTMEIPIKGGAVTGSITGFCEGSLKGAFDPRTNYTHGEIEGKCAGLPAKGTFKGEINLEKNNGSGTFEGSTLLIKKSGNWNLKID